MSGPPLRPVLLRLPGATAAARRAAAAVWRRDLPLLLRSGGLLPGGADRCRRCTSGVALRYDCPVGRATAALLMIWVK